MQLDKKKAVLVFSGYNQRAVVSLLRTLEQNNVKYFIFATTTEDTILVTKYRENVFWVKENHQLLLNEILLKINELRTKFDVEQLLIAPLTEFLNRFLLKNRDAFEETNCIVPLVDEQTYIDVSDKYSFGEICAGNGINLPQQSNRLEDFVIPFVAKPIAYQSKNKAIHAPKLILNEGDMKNFLETELKEDYYYQEFVGGESLYLLAYFSFKDETHYAFSQENLVQQAGGKSMILAVSSNFHFTEESNRYVQLLKKLSYKGLIMVEVKHHNGQYYMIEANPRFWGPSQLLLDSGNNFFEALLKDFDFINKDLCMNNDGNQKTYYLWRGGMIKDLKEKKEIKLYQSFWNNIPDTLKEIYNKKDTSAIYKLETMNDIEQLKNYYAKTSKHSNYQILPSKLSLILEKGDFEVKSRYEKERLDFYLDHVNFQGKNVVDIGGNSGYFTFEIIENKAKSVNYIEGNKAHYDFVKLAAEILNYREKIKCENSYVRFKEDVGQWDYDIIMLLNVLHHIGDDFGEKLTKEASKEKILSHLNKLAKNCKQMVFQLGFNWQGNPKTCLFDQGTKAEMIEFIKEGTKGHWTIETIGIAEKSENGVHYNPLNDKNIKRDDSLGEFLNRPIFILKSEIKS